MSECPSGLCERRSSLYASIRHRSSLRLPIWPDDFNWRSSSSSSSSKHYNCISLDVGGFWCQRKNTEWYDWSSSLFSSSDFIDSSRLKLSYVVDPSQHIKEKTTCISFTSHGYLCSKKTVHQESCTLGTVRSCYCYSSSSSSKILDGTQTCNLYDRPNVYENGILGRRRWSRCVCLSDDDDDDNVGWSHRVVPMLFWSCVILFLFVSLYVQVVRCCVRSRKKKGGYVRVGQVHEEEERMRLRARRRRRRRRKKIKGRSVEYTAVDLIDDDDDGVDD